MPTEASTQKAPPPPVNQQAGDFDPSRLVEALPLVGLLISIAASVAYGLPTGLIVIGATLLLFGIWNLWVSLQLVAGDRPGQAESIQPDAPSYEEEQKAFLLRALDDLEFERSVGKIDDDDYRVLRQQYRNRAKQALAAEDHTDPRRQQAESLALAYLAEKGLAGDSTSSGPPSGDLHAAEKGETSQDADDGKGQS